MATAESPSSSQLDLDTALENDPLLGRRSDLHIPFAHNLVFWTVVTETVLTALLFLSNLPILPSLARIALELLAWLCRLRVLFLRAQFLAYYLLGEPGDVTLSVIEPAHTIEAADLTIAFLLWEQAEQSSGPFRLRPFLARVANRIFLFHRFPFKIAKLLLYCIPPVCSFFESYLALRFSRFAIDESEYDVTTLSFWVALYLPAFVYFKGSFHAFLALTFLASTAISTVIAVLTPDVPMAVVLMWRQPDPDDPPKSLTQLQWYQKYISLGRTVMEAPWTDMITLNRMSDASDTHTYEMDIFPGTDTIASRHLAAAIPHVLNALLPQRVHVRASPRDMPFYSRTPIAAVSLYTLLQLSHGARPLSAPLTFPHGGAVLEQALRYTSKTERVEAMLDFALQRRRAAVVSYRHSETFEESCDKIEQLVSPTCVDLLWADVFVREVRRHESLHLQWILLGLEPYMYFTVVRETDVEDGDLRLWLSLEDKLHQEGNMDLLPARSISPELLHYLYYISGKVLRMRAFRELDVVEAAQYGHEGFVGRWHFPHVVDNLVYLFFRAAIAPHGMGLQDGMLYATVRVEAEEIELMSRMARILSRGEHSVYVLHTDRIENSTEENVLAEDRDAVSFEEGNEIEMQAALHMNVHVYVSTSMIRVVSPVSEVVYSTETSGKDHVYGLANVKLCYGDWDEVYEKFVECVENA